MPREKYKDEIRQIDVDRQVYYTLPENFNPAFFSFGCPIRHKVCGELEEIMKEYSYKNVFVAIPYSDYPYENYIVKTVKAAGCTPKLAKQKIQTKVLLCKICREIRKCGYGIVDISENNVNVAYELGLMQSLGKNCAILLRAGAEAQSDLGGIENVRYDSSLKLALELGRWIEGNLPEVSEAQLKEYLQSLKLTTKSERKFKTEEVKLRLSLLEKVHAKKARLDLWTEVRHKMPDLCRDDLRDPKVKDVVIALLDKIKNEMNAGLNIAICLDMVSIIARRADNFFLDKMKEDFLNNIEKLYDSLTVEQKRDALQILQPLNFFSPEFMENLVMKAINIREWSDEEFQRLNDTIDLWTFVRLHKGRLQKLHTNLWKLKAEAEVSQESKKRKRIEHFIKRINSILS